MLPAELSRSTDGYARRLLIVALATLMLFATLAVVPGGAIAADSDESTTVQSEEPAAVVDESTTATTAPPTDEPAAVVVDESTTTTTVATEELAMETTTTTTPAIEEVAAAPLATEEEPPSQSLATPPEEDSEPTLSPLAAGFGISIEKYTNGENADTPPGPTLTIGDPVTWTYVVTNLRHPAIHNITVIDSDPTVVVSCPTNQLSNIGQSMTCTADGIVLPDKYTNTATVTGTQSGRTVSASDESHYLGVEPAKIVVDKVTIPSGDPQEFGFTLLGLDNPTDETFTLAGWSTPYDSGRLDPGVYSVEEDDPGDPAVWQLTDVICEDLDNGVEFDDPSTLNLEAGVTITCTFTNAKTPTLNLLKTVTNDNGGTATAGDWTLTAIAAPPDDARNYSELGDHTAFETVYANTDYVLAESTIANYTPGTWSCDGGTLTDSTIRLAPGQTEVTCTINNNDNAPRLTMVKRVINSHGGNEVAASWTLTAAGTSGGFSEQAISSGNQGWARVGPKDVTADVEYTLSESGPSGYWPTPNHWSCIVNGGSAVAGNTITLSLGDSARCEIVNYDIQPSLRLIKTVTNDDGGDKPASDWDLSAWTTRNGNFYRALNFPDGGGDWQQGYDDPTSNQPYQLSEYGPSTGYLAGDWSCDGGHLNGRWLTLDEGERVTCTINNDDIAPTLKLVKHVVNDDGLTTVPNDWTLTATASAPDPTDRNLSNLGGSGNFEAVYANTAYVLAETGGSDGYLPGSWSCDNSVAVTGSTITLTEGQTDVTCTITNDDAEATLTLVKTVVNDDGGSLGVTDFPLFISGTPATSSVPYLFVAGTYTASETNQAGYTAGVWGGDCNDDGSIALARGQHATCTITNNDIAPTLKLVKTVHNDDGGTELAAAWTLKATSTSTNGDISALANQNPSADGLTGDTGIEDVHAHNEYTLSETGPANYTASDWSCTITDVGGTVGSPVTGDTITLAGGEQATCEIINDDDAPTLKLVKVVTTDDGGNKVADNWTLSATAAAPNSGRNFSNLGGSGDFETVYSNTGYVLDETSGPAGYTAGSWSCNGGTLVGSTITLAFAQQATCTITNDDIAPTLKIYVYFKNENSGTAVPHDFTMTATALKASDPSDRDYSHPGDHPTFEPVYANTLYQLDMLMPEGYLQWLGGCDGGHYEITGGGQITLDEGQTGVTCHLAATDQTTRLKLVKKVTNDNDGTARAGDWTLTATATDPTWDDKDYSHPGDHGTFEKVYATEYVLAETGGPTGYVPGTWSCDNGVTVTDSTITLPIPKDVTCTINNDDDTPPTLKLLKQVVNDNGGTELAAAWTLQATSTSTAGDFSLLADQNTSPDGRLGDTGTQTVYANNEYTLSESGPDGYTQRGQWVCYVDGGAGVESDTITLGAGESADCWASNDDVAPTLKLVKVVVNDDGGTAHADEWLLGAAGVGGIDPAHGTRVLDTVAVVGPKTVLSNVEFTLSETGPAGYTAGDWTCTITAAGGAVGSPVMGDKITLGEGESGSCQISNNDIAPTLQLSKNVSNHHGGNATASEWKLAATGDGGIAPTNGTELIPTAAVVGPQDVKANVEYTLSESDGPAGYTAGDWTCIITAAGGAVGSPVTGDKITLNEGESGACTIVNTDNAPMLNLFKQVKNDHGGTAVPADWTLKATSTSTDGDFALPADLAITPLIGATGVQNVFANNEYTLSETGTIGHTDDYTQDGQWSCAIDGAAPVLGNTITLNEGESATCKVVNDDDLSELTLVKHVVNDNGGTSVAADWTLKATSTSTNGDISALADQNTSADGLTGDTGAHEVHANNEYTLSETGATGYTQVGMWSCVVDGAAPVLSNAITLDHGAKATCTATNNDDAPRLKLFKGVNIGAGGDSVAADWTLIATSTSDDGDFSLLADKDTSPDGFTGSTGPQDVYANNTYTLSESGPSGYTQVGLWTCVIMDATGAVGEPVDGNTINLSEGESGQCHVNNTDIAPTLKLHKSVANDNGGDNVAADWTLTATSTSGDGDFSLLADKNTTPDFHEGDTGPQDVFANNTYTLSESGPSGYTQVGLWECVIMDATGAIGDPVDGNTITLREGEAAECGVINDDVAPTLKLHKSVANDNGGDSVAADWTLTATSTSGDGDFSLLADKNTTPGGLEGDTGTQDVYANNMYTLSETGPDGYTQVGSWECVVMDATGAIGDPVDGNTITLREGEAAECGAINIDIAPTLKLVKTVTTDDGGTAGPGDWTLTATAASPDDTSRNYSHPGDHASFETVFSNTAYVLAESAGPAGYAPGTWSCDGGTLVGSTISLDEGQTGVTCTINNNDVPPPTLRVIKTVVNDDGGSLAAADFPLFISGKPATSAVSYALSPGTYTASETNQAGYTAGVWGGDCAADGTVTLVSGQHATCTITNDDVAPTLKLIKTVDNSDGGDAVADDWTLSATAGGDRDFDNLGGSGVFKTVYANAGYALAETGPAGYTAGTWSCDGGTLVGSTITLGVGETDVTCTIVNDDNAASIDIEKATNGVDADDPTGPYIHVGDVVTWTYVVTNTGQADLEKILVEDSDRSVSVSCTESTLAVGASMTCTATGIAVAGQYENTGHVFGTAVTGAPVEDSDMSHYFGSDPAIGITKNVVPAVINVGEATDVTWTILVSNTGNVALADVAVTDALVAACDKTVGDLAVGGSSTYTCNSTHTPDNLTWTFTNVAVATGIGPAGTHVTANDDAEIVATDVAGTAQIGHIVWRDTDKDGVQDAGELGINGVTVILKDATGVEIARTVTANSSPDGSYKFTGLVAGTYTVQLDTSSVSGTLTTPGAFTITLVVGEDYVLANFGVADTLPVTGIESDDLTLLAVGLLMLGVFAVLSTHRRRGEER